MFAIKQAPVFVYIRIDSDIWAKIGISEVFAKGKQVQKYDVSCGTLLLLSVISAQKSKKSQAEKHFRAWQFRWFR